MWLTGTGGGTSGGELGECSLEPRSPLQLFYLQYPSFFPFSTISNGLEHSVIVMVFMQDVESYELLFCLQKNYIQDVSLMLLLLIGRNEANKLLTFE